MSNIIKVIYQLMGNNEIMTEYREAAINLHLPGSGEHEREVLQNVEAEILRRLEGYGAQTNT